MTASEPPREQSPGDDTALLTTALNHSWTWYEMRSGRAFQIVNYYLVAGAILTTAYTAAINGKHYDLAAAIAFTALGITALAAAAALHETSAATQAGPALRELQNRIAGRLNIDPIRMAKSQAGQIYTPTAVIVTTFGLAALLDITGMLYAVIH